MIETKAVLPISLRGNAEVDAGLLTPNSSVAESSVVGVISARIHSWHNFGPFEHVFLGVMVLQVLYFLAWIPVHGQRGCLRIAHRHGSGSTKYCLVGCQFSQLNAHHSLITLLNRIGCLHRTCTRKSRNYRSDFLVKR